jgi:hypothetical protein
MPPWLWTHRWSVVAGLTTFLALYRGIALVGAVFGSRPRIEISDEGFTDYGVLGQRSRRWSDIEGNFTVLRVGWPLALGLWPLVAYRLTDACKKSTRIGDPIASLQGNDEAILICEELSISAAELADILNQCKHGAPSGTTPQGDDLLSSA